jgi:hypothetical protein
MTLRSYITAGVALLGADFFAVTPVAPPAPDIRVASPAVRLTDASTAMGSVDGVSSLSSDLSSVENTLFSPVTFLDLGGLQNVPENLLDDIANIPYDEFDAPYTLPANLDYATSSGGVVDGTLYFYPGGGSLEYLPTTTNGGLNELTNVLNYDGDLFQLTSTNVLGIDPGDIPKELIVDTLLPFFGTGLYGTGADSPATEDGVNLLEGLAAEVPTSASCVGVTIGGCVDVTGLLDKYFTVSAAQLENGYVFPGATLTNPAVDPVPYAGTSDAPVIPPGVPTDGIPLVDSQHFEPLPYGNVSDPLTADPSAFVTDIYDNLTQTPTGIELPDPSAVLPTLGGLGEALFNTVNPFVVGSFCIPCQLVAPGGAPEITGESRLLSDGLAITGSGLPTTVSTTPPDISTLLALLGPATLAQDLALSGATTDTGSLLGTDLGTSLMGLF